MNEQRSTGAVLLIRHGIAEDPRPGQRDGERALTDEGWRRTRAAMRGLVAFGHAPCAIWSSPYRRAGETLDCLREALREAGLPEPPAGTWQGLQPESDPAEAEAWLRDRLGETGGGPVALVSHQPFLGELLYLLTGAVQEIRKASCTLVEFRDGRWRLVRHFAPSELRAHG